MKKKKIIEILKNLSSGLRIDFNQIRYGIISHPLTSSLHVVGKDGKIMILDSENIRKYSEWRCNLISDDAKNVHSIFSHVNKPYRIVFLSLVKEYLTEKEFNEVLGSVWTQVEYPHQESINNLVELFKQSKKELLMDKKELKKLLALPQEVTIYRGLQGRKAKIKGLSWTLSLEKAKWFANRWGNKGDVYGAKINRDDIFMYTNSRNEEEVVVNPFKLKQLQKVGVEA